MNIGVYVSFQMCIFIFFGYILRSGIAGSYVILFLVFWGTSTLLSTVAPPIYISTNSVCGAPFLYILTNIWCLRSFWWRPFWQLWADRYLIGDLIGISLVISAGEHLDMSRHHFWPEVGQYLQPYLPEPLFVPTTGRCLIPSVEWTGCLVFHHIYLLIFLIIIVSPVLLDL